MLHEVTVRHVTAAGFQAAAANSDDGESPEPRNVEASGRWEQPSAESQQENGTSVPEQQEAELGNSPNEPGNGSSPRAPGKEHSPADALILVW